MDSPSRLTLETAIPSVGRFESSLAACSSALELLVKSRFLRALCLPNVPNGINPSCNSNDIRRATEYKSESEAEEEEEETGGCVGWESGGDCGGGLSLPTPTPTPIAG